MPLQNPERPERKIRRNSESVSGSLWTRKDAIQLMTSLFLAACALVAKIILAGFGWVRKTKTDTGNSR